MLRGRAGRGDGECSAAGVEDAFVMAFLVLKLRFFLDNELACSVLGITAA